MYINMQMHITQQSIIPLLEQQIDHKQAISKCLLSCPFLTEAKVTELSSELDMTASIFRDRTLHRWPLTHGSAAKR